MAAASRASILLMSRDERQLADGGPSGSRMVGVCPSVALSGCSSSSASSGPLEGTLSTLRRSLRQMNPFKSRLFRLPATPRLSRSKKVLGRGEDLTGWNFERPSADRAANSPRPLSSSSFGPSDILLPPAFRGPERRLSELDGAAYFQQQQRSTVPIALAPFAAGPPAAEECHCCAAAAGVVAKAAPVCGDQLFDGAVDDLDQFLSAMESIARRSQMGGSCRLPSSQPAQGHPVIVSARGCGTVTAATGELGGGGVFPSAAAGGRRSRPAIPASFIHPHNQPTPCWPPNDQQPWNNGLGLGHRPPRECCSPAPSPRCQPPAECQRREQQQYKFLPSTCYAPDGEMYAARWRPGQSLMQCAAQPAPPPPPPTGAHLLPAAGQSPRLPNSSRPRPQPLYLPVDQQSSCQQMRQFGGGGKSVDTNNEMPKSPTQSAITLLATGAQPKADGMRSASTATVTSSSAAIRQRQSRPQLAAALFPQTQLQRRRSACSSVSVGAGSRARVGPAEEEEGNGAGDEPEANYYGRDVLRLMGLSQPLLGGTAAEFSSNPSAGDKGSPSTLLPCPPLLFPMEDQLFQSPFGGLAPPPSPTPVEANGTGNEEGVGLPFVGREWLFKELCQQLVTEKAQLVLLMGAHGSGKSAVMRQIVANSNFAVPKVVTSTGEIGQNQQHNTVDSGIAIGGGRGGNSSSGTSGSGGNSSGSQLSLLNVSGHIIPSADLVHLLPSPVNHHRRSPTPSGGGTTAGRNYQWLRAIGQHLCAFHFAQLHSASSCSVAEFVRSLCAQLCRCPQLKGSYAKLICSDARLHQLACQEETSLSVEPLELFRLLLIAPLRQIYGCCEEQQAGAESERERVAALAPPTNKMAARRSASRGSDYGSNYGSGNRQPAGGGTAASELLLDGGLPSLVLVLVDGLDEAGFHRTDGGESIGWLLRRALPECPPQLRFLCSLAPAGPGPVSEQFAIFGSSGAGTGPLEARSIRLDDWELDERLGRDARLFVETRVQSSPALDKWVTAQFRRQSFFASDSNHPQQQLQMVHQQAVADFAVQLVQRVHANFAALQLALGMLADGRLLSLATLPAELGQLFALHLRHKFPSPAHFHPIAPLLAVMLASLRPLGFDELFRVLSADQSGDFFGENELRNRLAQLSPLVLPLPRSDLLVLVHSSLRDWLLKEGAVQFSIDIRHGHILLALSLIRLASSQAISREQLFELAHHLLKANPHKYMREELASRLDLPRGRDAQVQWLRRAVGGRALADALLFRRNVFYPNSKVSRLLLLAGADPNASQWPDSRDCATDCSLLCAFAGAGNLEMVHLLLQFGAIPSAGCPPPLIVAVRKGHDQIVKLLCASGVDLSAKDPEGRGALFHAAANDSLTMLGFLLEAIAEDQAKGRRQHQKQQQQQQNGQREHQQQLLMPEPEVGGTDREGGRRYSLCSTTGGCEQQQQCEWREEVQRDEGLADASSNSQSAAQDRSEAIREAFEVAAERGSVRVCRFLLESTDAVLDTTRAMCIACANGRSEVVQFLLSRGATLSPEQMWNGKSALVCAVESGSWDLVVNVLNGAGPNALAEVNAMVGPNRLSPLMVAARHGHVGLVDLLVNRGAQLDAADTHGRTAAMHAIEAGHSSTVGLLLERGCNVHARDQHRNTMLHLLARHPVKCLINRLLEAGLGLEDKNREELRPLEVALQCGQLLAVDTFLRRGARLRSLTWQTALRSHPPLVLVLLRKLLDDAQILLRRKRTADALHRLNYALHKCDELLARADGEEGGEGNNDHHQQRQQQQQEDALQAIRPQLRRHKVQSLHSIAALKRRANDLPGAISMASEALEILNGTEPSAEGPEGRQSQGTEASTDEEQEEGTPGGGQHRERRFELHLLRAKCHFDARDLDRARVDAQLAACLRPGDLEAQNLLAVLSMG